MKLTETPPVRCSSCFGQYTDREHVDFESAWEGPTFKEGIVGQDGEITNSLLVSIDDLIICDECLRAAAKLLGLVEPGELGERLEEVEAERDELRVKVRGLSQHKANLERAVASKRELART